MGLSSSQRHAKGSALVNEEKSGATQTPEAAKGTPLRLIVCLALIVIGGIVWLAWPPREPSYQGKSLSYWLSSQMYQGTGSSNALRSIGTNAIPTLLRLLKSKDSALTEKLSDLIERQSFVHNPIVSADEKRQKASLGFLLLGQMATNAVPALIDIYQRPPSPESKEIADGVLKELYLLSGVTKPYWIPVEKRSQWFFETGQRAGDWSPIANSNAINAFSEAIKLDPTNVGAYWARGSVKVGLHDFDGAIADLNATIKLSPTNEGAILLRGFCKFNTKDYIGAEADFTDAMRLQTNEADLYNLRGLARANVHKRDDAIADFNQALHMDAAQSEVYRNRAMVECLQKNYELALADASKSIDMNGKDSFAFLTRGEIENALKDYDAALADFNKAIEMKPEEQTAEYYATRAATWLCLDEFTNAAADVQKALQLDPKNLVAFLVRGMTHAKLGEDDLALADFQHAAELAPEKVEGCGILGFFQLKTGDWKSALVNFRKALAVAEPMDKSDFYAGIWLIRAQSGEEQAANAELADYLKTLKQTNEWCAITARFFMGSLPESNFLALATTAAKRPSAVKEQVCDSLYFAAMKRKIAGDRMGAAELFQKCIETKYDNSLAYLIAKSELEKLKQAAEK
jgi:tetratricopeptide (TPR) repeat protein